MCGRTTSVSAPEIKKAPVAPAIVTPVEAEASTQEASAQERRRRQAASGRSDTILTGGLGVNDQAVTTGGNKILGG